MRNAEVADHWRRLYGKQRPERLASFVVRRSSFPREADVLDLPAFSVLCGGNGAGKSSILAVLYASLTADDSTLPPHLHQGTVEVILHDKAGAWKLLCDLADVPSREAPKALPFSEVRWLDAARDSAAARSRFIAEPDLDELLAQFGARDFSAEQLKLCCYVTRKSYKRITVTIVEDELAAGGLNDDEESIITATPHFEVDDEGTVYDTRTMGAGELACISLLWRLFEAPAQSLVLIEEPETHVSPASQLQLLNVMARIAYQRNLSLIVSTHSVEMLHRLPPEAIRIVEPLANSLQITVPRSLHEVRFSVGSEPAPARFVVVEDRLATVVLHELLAASRILPALGVDVVYAGSNTDAVDAVKRFGKLNPPVGSVAIADGDQRGKLESCLFLPGSRSPEQELISAISEKKRAFSKRIGRSESEVAAALHFVKGQDSHEAWHEFWKKLNSNSDALARAAVHVWMTIPGVKSAVRRLVKDITEALSPLEPGANPSRIR